MAKNWCDESDPTKKKALNFIRDRRDEAGTVAEELGIPRKRMIIKLRALRDSAVFHDPASVAR